MQICKHKNDSRSSVVGSDSVGRGVISGSVGGGVMGEGVSIVGVSYKKEMRGES